MGHHVVTCGMRYHLDIVLKGVLIPFSSLLERLPEGFEPECIIMLDESAPIILTGLEEAGIPIIFYSVDTHHHMDCHSLSCINFDSVLVAQKDYIPQMRNYGLEPEWFPLWSSRTYEGSDDKQHDAVFVGTMDPKLNPDRVKFFDQLKALTPIHFARGDFWKIFPFAEIVMNQTVKGDLNFRVFEAMMSGSALLTERTENGLLDLFVENEHLVTYQKNDPQDAAAKIEWLLKDRSFCRQVGKQGRECIMEQHLPLHRAQRISQLAQSTRRQTRKIRYFCQIPNYLWIYKKIRDFSDPTVLATLQHLFMLLEQGLMEQEAIHDSVFWHIVFICVEIDYVTRGNAGENLLRRLDEAYPAADIFKLAQIWILLNRGEREVAITRARNLTEMNTEEVFKKVNLLMTGIMGI